MSGPEFAAWIEAMGFSDAEAARRLGLGSRNTLAKYKREGCQLYIALACAALAKGFAPWPG